ncbi:MAG: Ribbon-helix-helix protein copG family [Verrucomicrobiales bacterium]|nr:Ribbon-helix-helix protein copG family [Verrucomicrobiales bacterium]
MNRTQIYLTPAESQGVARVAAETGRKQSEVIREAIDQYLGRLGPHDRLSRLREARGIWAGREISLESIRGDFDRF